MLGTPRNFEGTANIAAAEVNLPDVFNQDVPRIAMPTVGLQIDNTSPDTDMHVSFDGGTTWLPIVAQGSWDGEVRLYRFSVKANANGVLYKGVATYS